MKYIYLTAHGGFNDILCVIEHVINVCKKNNRTLLLDTINNLTYKINFSDYFNLVNVPIIYDMNEIKKIVFNKNLSIFPNILNNKMEDIVYNKVPISYKRGGFQYDNTNINLVLPSNEQKEDIIVHVACGNGHNSFNFFNNHIFFKTDIINYCNNNLNKINKPYICLYIRNTDIKCNYKNLYNTHKELIHTFKNVYIASDDKNVISFFKKLPLNIYNFTTFPSDNYKGLHYSNIDKDIKIKDLISDLYIISMADKLVSNSKGGFNKLVSSCNKNASSIKNKFIT
jgi:hypothetical protein